MGISIDLTNTERRVSTAEFALRMNISEKELYDRIKTGRVKRPIKDGRKNFWLNSYVLTCILNEENSILVDYDPIQIADRMEYYFNHPDELATIRKKGMDFVKGTSWYKEAEKVYASMLKGIEEDEKKLQ